MLSYVKWISSNVLYTYIRTYCCSQRREVVAVWEGEGEGRAHSQQRRLHHQPKMRPAASNAIKMSIMNRYVQEERYIHRQMWLFVWIYGIVSLSLSLQMLLCDECDNECHTYCQYPRLWSIPKGKWICPLCSEVCTHVYTHTHATTPPFTPLQKNPSNLATFRIWIVLVR